MFKSAFRVSSWLSPWVDFELQASVGEAVTGWEVPTSGSRCPVSALSKIRLPPWTWTLVGGWHAWPPGAPMTLRTVPA